MSWPSLVDNFLWLNHALKLFDSACQSRSSSLSWQFTGAQDHSMLGFSLPSGSQHLNFNLRRISTLRLSLRNHPKILNLWSQYRFGSRLEQRALVLMLGPKQILWGCSSHHWSWFSQNSNWFCWALWQVSNVELLLWSV